MKKAHLGLLILILVFAILAEMILSRHGYVINLTAVGICATAFVAILQLRENSDQKVKDRALETKRDVLFDGVRGMARANLAFASLANIEIPYGDSINEFQTAMSQITVSACVASLRTAKAGKKFSDTIGPNFIKVMAIRIKLDSMSREDKPDEHLELFKELNAEIMRNAITIAKVMLQAIAAVRSDVGIAKESEDDFLKAVYPDEDLLRRTIDDGLRGLKDAIE